MRRNLRKLPIPVMPILAWLAAKRGLRIVPAPPDGTERSIYAGLKAELEVRRIFDIGANIGAKALAFSSSFPEADIYCFEPIATTHQLLRANTANNPRINCFSYAIGDSEGTALMASEANSQLSRLVSATEFAGPQSRQEVTLTTIDAFCAAHGIDGVDIIKTDTEGHDLAVLRGARGTLESSVKFVMSEVGMKQSDTRHSPFHSINEYLTPIGFVCAGFYNLNYDDDGTVSYADALFVRAKQLPTE